MCALFTSLGSASALMLLASVLVTGAVGDGVITQQCRDLRGLGRVRQYPEDRDATWLRLDQCNLHEINEADIIGLPYITTIDLEINDIAQVDPAVFRHVPILETMYLYDNKLRELPAFPEHSCPRLVYFHLNRNQLTSLHDAGTFSACTHLQRLILNSNQIHYIHPDVFSSLTELERLDLDHNKLSFIPDQMFSNNKKLRELWLNNNRLTFLPHEFASSFKRAGVGLDTFYFHGNPWRCACLLELLTDVKRAGVSDYDSRHKYEGTEPECAYSDAAPCSRHPPSDPPLVVLVGGR